MTELRDSSLTRLAAGLAIFSCVLLAGTPAASGVPSPKETHQVPLRIELQDAQGARVSPEIHRSSFKALSAVLDFDRDYQPGDRIILSGPRRMAVRIDKSMRECVLYLPDSSQGNVSYEIPYGRAEQQTGSAYAPEGFSGKSHSIEIRALKKKEITAYRNLALNPCDLRETDRSPARFFPHATTNSVSRNLFDFEARNAIDGVTQNGHHGVWPYQSWGPQLRTDLWWKLDFGRPVQLDKIRLMVRADFPHDSYWKSADVEFSDGTRLPIQITSSADFQNFPFPKRRVSWLRLTNLVPSDPTRWCSFIEVEAWGRDLP